MPFMVLWAEGDPVEGEWGLIADQARRWGSGAAIRPLLVRRSKPARTHRRLLLEYKERFIK